MAKAHRTFTLRISGEYCKGCRLCVECCPRQVLGLTQDRINAKGYPFAETVRPDQCIGCGRCTLVCPDAVIEIFEVD